MLLPASGLVEFFPPSQHPEQRVLAQLLMIVQVFIAQSQPVHPLRNHLQNGMFHSILLAAVQETMRESRQQIQPLIGLPQQQRASVGTDRAAVKPRHHLTRIMGFEFEAGLSTLCHSKSRSSPGASHLKQKMKNKLSMFRRPRQAQ